MADWKSDSGTSLAAAVGTAIENLAESTPWIEIEATSAGRHYHAPDPHSRARFVRNRDRERKLTGHARVSEPLLACLDKPVGKYEMTVQPAMDLKSSRS
jgi:hypothetical protein